MSTPTEENRDLLTVVAYMQAADGNTEELRAALEALNEPTSKKEGNVNYDLTSSDQNGLTVNGVRRIA